MKIQNKDQAIAFALFLLFEKHRHLQDIKWIDNTLSILSKKWNLTITNTSVNDIEMKPEEMWVGHENI